MTEEDDLPELPLILASASPNRAEMLRDAGLNFEIMPAQGVEEALKPKLAHLPPARQAKELARAKALSISNLHPDALVLGADQICELEGKTFGKPGSPRAAVAQLLQLSGKKHIQHTAACLCRGGEVIWEEQEEARLLMRPLSEHHLRMYVAIDMPLHAAGAYHYEEHGHHLFEQVEGSRECILGLPLDPLLSFLRAQEAISLTG